MKSLFPSFNKERKEDTFWGVLPLVICCFSWRIRFSKSGREQRFQRKKSEGEKDLLVCLQSGQEDEKVLHVTKFLLSDGASIVTHIFLHCPLISSIPPPRPIWVWWSVNSLTRTLLGRKDYFSFNIVNESCSLPAVLWRKMQKE